MSGRSSPPKHRPTTSAGPCQNGRGEHEDHRQHQPDRRAGGAQRGEVDDPAAGAIHGSGKRWTTSTTAPGSAASRQHAPGLARDEEAQTDAEEGPEQPPKPSRSRTGGRCSTRASGSAPARGTTSARCQESADEPARSRGARARGQPAPPGPATLSSSRSLAPRSGQFRTFRHGAPPLGRTPPAPDHGASAARAQQGRARCRAGDLAPTGAPPCALAEACRSRRRPPPD